MNSGIVGTTDERSWAEGRKLFFDTMKPIATLSTGSIVAIVTVGSQSLTGEQSTPILSKIALSGLLGGAIHIHNVGTRKCRTSAPAT